MPYKNPLEQKKYMKRYMKGYRKWERDIIQQARKMGVQPPKPWKPPSLKPRLKPRKPQKRRR